MRAKDCHPLTYFLTGLFVSLVVKVQLIADIRKKNIANDITADDATNFKTDQYYKLFRQLSPINRGIYKQNYEVINDDMHDLIKS